VTADEVPEYVERVLENFTRERAEDEAFADWVERADEGSLR
jgi:sulfite reductase (ferredoxin)